MRLSLFNTVVFVWLMGVTACSQTNPASPVVAAAELPPAAPAQFGLRRTSRLLGTSGLPLGTVVLWQGVEGVLVQLDGTGLPPGWHGVHLHDVGDCSDTGQFVRSGGHVHGKGKPHGFLNPAGAHAGDLPNAFVHRDGTVRVDFFVTRLTLDSLFDADGAALVVHAAADDYQTQPIGRAGARVACAAFGDGERS